MKQWASWRWLPLAGGALAPVCRQPLFSKTRGGVSGGCRPSAAPWAPLSLPLSKDYVKKGPWIGEGAPERPVYQTKRRWGQGADGDSAKLQTEPARSRTIPRGPPTPTGRPKKRLEIQIDFSAWEMRGEWERAAVVKRKKGERNTEGWVGLFPQQPLGRAPHVLET